MAAGLKSVIKLITKNPKVYSKYSQSPKQIGYSLKKAKIEAPQSLNYNDDFLKRLKKENVTDKEIIDRDFVDIDTAIDVEESLTDLVIAVQNKINKKLPKEVKDIFRFLNEDDKKVLDYIINDPTVSKKQFEKLINNMVNEIETNLVLKEYNKPMYIKVERSKPTKKILKSSNERKKGGSVVERNPYNYEPKGI